jgi:hypothetical protein
VVLAEMVNFGKNRTLEFGPGKEENLNLHMLGLGCSLVIPH